MLRLVRVKTSLHLAVGFTHFEISHSRRNLRSVRETEMLPCGGVLDYAWASLQRSVDRCHPSSAGRAADS